LEYARESKGPVGPVFDCVRKQFQADSDETYKLVSRLNSFRNTYVAHQKKELTDPAMAKTAMVDWTNGLCRLWELHG